jgi:hypothetical protein
MLFQYAMFTFVVVHTREELSVLKILSKAVAAGTWTLDLLRLSDIILYLSVSFFSLSLLTPTLFFQLVNLLEKLTIC